MNCQLYSNDAAWTCADLKDERWIYELEPEQLRELYRAAKSLPDDESAWLDLKSADFDLARFTPVFDRANRELERGRGFCLLRGIELRGDRDFAYRVNWILALGLGNVIAQNANGEVIGAVEAVVQATDNGANTRGYVSNAELRFHCDGGDVASLLCVRQAPEGGMSSLVSMISIHNTMLKECPHHLEVLYQGLKIFMRAEKGLKSAISEKPLPIFMPQDDGLLAFINLRLMELVYESQNEDMPADKRAALDAFEEIAERPEHKFSLKLQPGDLLLTHNFTCMHKRSSFVDDPDPDNSRLMLRLWYNIPGGRVEAIQAPDKRAGYFTQAPYVIKSC